MNEAKDNEQSKPKKAPCSATCDRGVTCDCALEILSDEDGLAYIQKHLHLLHVGRLNSKDEWVLLLRAVGNVRGALKQAICCLNNHRGLTLEKYIEKLEAKKRSLLMLKEQPSSAIPSESKDEGGEPVVLAAAAESKEEDGGWVEVASAEVAHVPVLTAQEILEATYLTNLESLFEKKQLSFPFDFEPLGTLFACAYLSPNAVLEGMPSSAKEIGRLKKYGFLEEGVGGLKKYGFLVGIFMHPTFRCLLQGQKISQPREECDLSNLALRVHKYLRIKYNWHSFLRKKALGFHTWDTPSVPFDCSSFDYVMVDQNIFSGLIQAAEVGRLDLVRLFLVLCEIGVVGRGPLVAAAANNHLAIVELLVKRGIDTNVRDINGKGSLHYAAEAGHTEMVQFLLANGADITLRDVSGRTPLNYAAIAHRQNNREAVFILLMLQGAAEAEITAHTSLPPAVSEEMQKAMNKFTLILLTVGLALPCVSIVGEYLNYDISAVAAAKPAGSSSSPSSARAAIPMGDGGSSFPAAASNDGIPSLSSLPTQASHGVSSAPPSAPTSAAAFFSPSASSGSESKSDAPAQEQKKSEDVLQNDGGGSFVPNAPGGPPGTG